MLGTRRAGPHRPPPRVAREAQGGYPQLQPLVSNRFDRTSASRPHTGPVQRPRRATAPCQQPRGAAGPASARGTILAWARRGSGW